MFVPLCKGRGIMPKTLAYLVLVAVVMFRKLPRPEAGRVALLAGDLLTPSAPSVNLPLLPHFDKPLSAAIGMLAVVCATREPS